jgi:hypothetical protein
LQIEPKNLKNYASGFIVPVCTRSVQAYALLPSGLRFLIFAIAASSIASAAVDTFNPQKAGSGLIVDTLAAQLYDRLLMSTRIPTSGA